jgi:hypothetical protein
MSSSRRLPGLSKRRAAVSCGWLSVEGREGGLIEPSMPTKSKDPIEYVAFVDLMGFGAGQDRLDEPDACKLASAMSGDWIVHPELSDEAKTQYVRYLTFHRHLSDATSANLALSLVATFLTRDSSPRTTAARLSTFPARSFSGVMRTAFPFVSVSVEERSAVRHSRWR